MTECFFDLAQLTDAHVTAPQHLPPLVDIYDQGEISSNLYIISRGWVCLYRVLADGRRQNLKFALAGDIIGYLPEGRAYVDHSAASITPVDVHIVDTDRMHRKFRNDPELSANFAAYLMYEETMVRERLIRVARTSACERVAYLLYELFARQHRRPPARGDTMRLPLTQEHIGDAMGLSSVHVNRMLAQLRRDGVLLFSGGRLLVLDASRLAQLAGIDRDTALPYFRHNALAQQLSA